MSEWKNVCLDDIAESINTGLDAIRRAPIVDFETNIKCLRIQDISQNKPIEQWGFTEVKPIDYEKYQLKENDIIMARTCSTGICFLVKEDMPAVFNNGLARIRLNNDIASPKFMYYVFKSKDFANYISGISCGTSVQLNMKIGDLSKYQFKLPTLSEQEEIAEVLGILDQKIELNTQLNQTLEQIAQATFKSWFIDFDPVRAKAAALADGQTTAQAQQAAMQAISGKNREELHRLQTDNPTAYQQLTELAEAFPSELVEVDGVEVPKGWEVNTLGESYNITMGQSPKGETYNENGEGTLFFQGRAEFGWRYPSPRLYTSDPKRMAKKGNILMSVRAPVGDLNLALNDCCIGRGLASLEHRKGHCFGIYQMKSLKNILDQFNGEGTVFGSINQKDLKSISVILPSIDIIQAFEENISNIDKSIEINSLASNNLEKVRDLLLPRLLNGEI